MRTFTLLLMTLLLGASAPLASATNLKLGTLAPEKSPWTKIFTRMGADFLKEAGITLQLFPGGTQGDEKEMVEKLRTGQLQMVAVTSVGLGELAPETLIFQTPGLVTDDATLDRVRGQLRARFEAKLLQNGVVLLGWGDVGTYYYYSNKPIRKPADLADARVWVWNEDAAARQNATDAGISAVPLGVPDVLAALNTGQVDTFYSSPVATLTLGWYPYMKYRTTHAVAMGVGAILISKAAFDALTEDQQQKVKSVGAKWAGALVKKVRRDNDKATTILTARKIEDVTPSADEVALWRTHERKVQDNLVGKIYDQALLDEVRTLIGQ